MRKMMVILFVISNLLVAASIVLAFINIEFNFINTSSFVDKMLSWLVFMLFIFLVLVVVCIWVYSLIYFWTPGNAFIVIILTTLCGFLILALPMEVIQKYFDIINQTSFPTLFYVFFAVFFSLDFLIVAILLLGDERRLSISAIVIRIIPIITAIIILSAFITVYGYSAILYLQDEAIDITSKVFVTIANVIYFLVFLIVPLVGITKFYLSYKGD